MLRRLFLLLALPTLTWAGAPGDWSACMPLAAGSCAKVTDLLHEPTVTLSDNGGLPANRCVFSTTGIICEGATANGIETLITVADPSSSDKTFTIPNTTGTAVTTGDTGTVTSTMIADATITTTDLSASAAITAGQIADISRTMNVSIKSFIECTTNGGADINYTSGADAFPDYVCSATDGLGCTLDFDDTGGSVDTADVCAQFVVPADYASGGAFVVRALKDAETGANTEVLNCAVSVNGAALQTAGTVTISGAASASYTCTPTIAALVAGDSVSFEFHITSGGTVDDVVSIASVGFQYTATQ